MAAGQEVKVRGTIEDNKTLTLANCTITGVGPSTVVPATFQEVMAEKDKPGFGRFKDKSLLMRLYVGPMRAKPSREHSFRIEASTAPGAEPTIAFSLPELAGHYGGTIYGAKFEEVQSGQLILVLANIDQHSVSSKGQVALTSARLLNEPPPGITPPEKGQ